MSVVNVGRWMGWVECEDDGDTWLECCMVLWQAGKTYSDSIDAAGVSVSRARGALDKLDLRRRVYTCIRVSDALLRVYSCQNQGRRGRMDP